MKRAEAVKFPNSIQLFKFCQKVLMYQRGNDRVNDQEIGNILEFNPSDCSHWKRGEKSVRSVFSLAKLAETLKVEASLINDLATGAIVLDEAFFEYTESTTVQATLEKANAAGASAVAAARTRVEAFVAQLHSRSQFTTAPLYLPEVIRFFPFVQMQPVEMIDRLSRVLRARPGHYIINYRKGDLKAQTRMSVLKDLAKIIFDAERSQFPELGPVDEKLLAFEQLVFVSSLLAPRSMLLEELARLDSRKNVVSELAALFWIPKSLLTFQLQQAVRSVSEKAPTKTLSTSIQANPSAIEMAG